MKYMGSKARIAKHILPIILAGRKDSQWYVEPFAGGMNTICRVTGPRIAADANYHLIEMWRAIAGGWRPPGHVSKYEYCSIKERPCEHDPSLVGWVGFNCSYSGKWFGGYAGHTKTKIGTIRDYQAEAIKNVTAQAAGLRDVVFLTGDYLCLDVPPSSLIYCDPPYEGTTHYAKSIDHNLFWQWVRNKSVQGNTVFVSEYKAPPDFSCVWEGAVKSSLSANGRYGGSMESIEKLFVYSP